MAKTYWFTFEMWAILNKIKCMFYKGEEDEPLIVYGDSKDMPDHTHFTFQNIEDSDLMSLDVNRFKWYTKYQPKLGHIFETEFEDKCCIHYKRWEGNDDRTMYNIDCPQLGHQLLKEIFTTHTRELDAAIRMCDLSLTSETWNSYLRDYKEWKQTIPSNTRASQIKCNVDNQRLAWGKMFFNRPTVLLDEPAIEVSIHRLDTSVNSLPQGFHVDDPKLCFRGTTSAQCTKYGMACIILPGSANPTDQLSTEISSVSRTWERNGAAIWMPTNVVHGGRGTQDTNRNIYIIEILANGQAHMINGHGEHKSENLKAFRMRLSELLEIQQHVGKSAGKRSRSEFEKEFEIISTNPFKNLDYLGQSYNSYLVDTKHLSPPSKCQRFYAY